MGGNIGREHGIGCVAMKTIERGEREVGEREEGEREGGEREREEREKKKK